MSGGWLCPPTPAHPELSPQTAEALLALVRATLGQAVADPELWLSLHTLCPLPIEITGHPHFCGDLAPSHECSQAFDDRAIQCCWLQFSQPLMLHLRASAGGNWEEPMALFLRNAQTALAFASFPPSTPCPRGNMELCSLSNSHSGADMNGKESEAQLLVLETREVCWEAAGEPPRSTRQVGDSDTSFSTVEQLSSVFSWPEDTLGLWQWKQGGKSSDVQPETN